MTDLERTVAGLRFQAYPGTVWLNATEVSGSLREELLARSSEAALTAIKVFNDPLTQFKLKPSSC